MPHIHWVTRQNKLELPNDKEEVNMREIHKCDGLKLPACLLIIIKNSINHEVVYYKSRN